MRMRGTVLLLVKNQKTDVITGLVPAIQYFESFWITGTSPVMTSVNSFCFGRTLGYDADVLILS